jgi:general secretion pathway protein H
VVPTFGSLEGRTFGVQVRAAISLLNYARRTAVVTGQPSTASFYPVPDEEENVADTKLSSVGIWQSSGAKILFRDSTDRESEIQELIEITFYPEGGSTGGTLLLAQGVQLMSIKIDPFTGRVVTEYEED